ncbi:hypothetical protein BGZ75_007218 [Mortierella antarctica]|nr:hypothetical protein BGZ75_007218 [Mortierella antarctica]
MKTTAILAAIIAAAASTVSAFTCPDDAGIANACRSSVVRPLTCDNPKLFIVPCNAKQCNQPYVDNYAACQCRRNRTDFFQNAVNVEGLIRRCNMKGLVNPYGNPGQYRPGQGTQTFAPTRTAAPVVSPTETGVPISTQNHHISKGAIAGIVLGILGATALAALLGLCWRKKRNEHTTVYNSHAGYDNRGPTRTVVTEKIEPVVVKSVPGGAASGTTYSTPVTGASTIVPGTTGNYNPTTTHSGNVVGTSTHPGGVNGIHNAGTTTHTTGVNSVNHAGTTATTTGYNSQPRTGVVDSVTNAAHNTGAHVNNATH